MHSEEETFRVTLRVHTLDGEPHTVLVLRRISDGQWRVWLTLNGAWKTTLKMTNPEATQLAELLTQAQQPPSSESST